MVIDTSTPENLQLEVLKIATYILNRIKSIDSLIPIKKQRQDIKLRDQLTLLYYLYIQFSKAYIYILAEKHQKAFKIKLRAQIGYLVGYKGKNSYLYQIYDLVQNKVFTYYDIVFQESNNKQFKQDLKEITKNIKEFSF